jgi:D-aminoacyl-tRNA deacylase
MIRGYPGLRPGLSQVAPPELSSGTVNTMRAVVQRVIRAQVTVDEEVTGKIANGLLVLLGVSKTDTAAVADYLAAKIAGLRIFDDDNGKMNLSVSDVGGSVLVVSQFTLYGDVRRGKRPSFDDAAPSQQAKKLYEYFVERIRATGLPCETGRFQATMQVELVNDGPVTILLDLPKPKLRSLPARVQKRNHEEHAEQQIRSGKNQIAAVHASLLNQNDDGNRIAEFFHHRRNHQKPIAYRISGNHEKRKLPGQGGTDEAVIKTRMRDGRRVHPADEVKHKVERSQRQQAPPASNTKYNFCKFHGNDFVWSVVLREEPANDSNSPQCPRSAPHPHKLAPHACGQCERPS